MRVILVLSNISIHQQNLVGSLLSASSSHSIDSYIGKLDPDGTDDHVSVYLTVREEKH